MKSRFLILAPAVASIIALAACKPDAPDQATGSAPNAVASDRATASQKLTAGEAVEKARRQAAKTDAVIEQTDANIRAADQQLREATERAKRQGGNGGTGGNSAAE